MDPMKIEAMEWARRKGMTVGEQLEFGQFQVGFPETMAMEDIYTSYMAAKYGPSAISMDTQENK